MTGDVIGTFRNTTPAVNQEFVQKIQIETNMVSHILMLKKLICQSCVFTLRHFAAQCFRDFQNTKRENEQVPTKKTIFDRLHLLTRLPDDIKNASFGQKKN